MVYRITTSGTHVKSLSELFRGAPGPVAFNTVARSASSTKKNLA
jgi:hypothetical protein